jgi:hypothetical protein
MRNRTKIITAVSLSVMCLVTSGFLLYTKKNAFKADVATSDLSNTTVAFYDGPAFDKYLSTVKPSLTAKKLPVCKGVRGERNCSVDPKSNFLLKKRLPVMVTVSGTARECVSWRPVGSWGPKFTSCKTTNKNYTYFESTNNEGRITLTTKDEKLKDLSNRLAVMGLTYVLNPLAKERISTITKAISQSTLIDPKIIDGLSEADQKFVIDLTKQIGSTSYVDGFLNYVSAWIENTKTFQGANFSKYDLRSLYTMVQAKDFDTSQLKINLGKDLSLKTIAQSSNFSELKNQPILVKDLSALVTTNTDVQTIKTKTSEILTAGLAEQLIYNNTEIQKYIGSANLSAQGTQISTKIKTIIDQPITLQQKKDQITTYINSLSSTRSTVDNKNIATAVNSVLDNFQTRLESARLELPTLSSRFSDISTLFATEYTKVITEATIGSLKEVFNFMMMDFISLDTHGYAWSKATYKVNANSLRNVNLANDATNTIDLKNFNSKAYYLPLKTF